MQLYLPFIEDGISKLYNTLNEKNRRLYAAIEALKVGTGVFPTLPILLAAVVRRSHVVFENCNHLPMVTERNVFAFQAVVGSRMMKSMKILMRNF